MAVSYTHLDVYKRQGYDSILCCTGNSLETKRQYFDLLRSKKVDAIILAGSKFIEQKAKDNSYIVEASGEIPVMLVNGYLEGENIYCTLCDDRMATHQATSQLIASGCRRILYLFTSQSYSGTNKMKGYRDALSGHGLPVREEYIRQCPKDVLAARDLLLALHESGLDFDAVLTSDDTLAVGTVKYAHITGRSIPDNLSIVGFNLSLIHIFRPPGTPP